ncbi:unnamed protein product [Linum trigynum]|uniref:CCHC-type domain-containing protein n=1 Tax=Linum trigynum TaxID=586398 RepID=A0AAV2CVL4_9ROSI
MELGSTNENLPQICFECGRIGHNEDRCSKKLGASSALTVAVETNSEARSSEQPSEPPAGYGSWIQVTQKSRKPNRKPMSNQTQTVTNPQGKGGNSEKIMAKITHLGKDAQATGNRGGKGKGTETGHKKEGDGKQKGKVNGCVVEGAKGGTSQIEFHEWRPSQFWCRQVERVGEERVD